MTEIIHHIEDPYVSSSNPDRINQKGYWQISTLLIFFLCFVIIIISELESANQDEIREKCLQIWNVPSKRGTAVAFNYNNPNKRGGFGQGPFGKKKRFHEPQAMEGSMRAPSGFSPMPPFSPFAMQGGPLNPTLSAQAVAAAQLAVKNKQIQLHPQTPSLPAPAPATPTPSLPTTPSLPMASSSSSLASNPQPRAHPHTKPKGPAKSKELKKTEEGNIQSGSEPAATAADFSKSRGIINLGENVLKSKSYKKQTKIDLEGAWAKKGWFWLRVRMRPLSFVPYLITAYGCSPSYFHADSK